MKKQHFIIAGIIAVIGGLGFFKYYQTQHPEKFPSATPTETVASNGSESNTNTSNGQPSSGKTFTKPTLNITTDVPENGTYKGVIEVGASGFNAFVVNMDKNKNWEMVSKQFGESLAYEGFANTEDVYAQMKKYISVITEKGVAGRNVHFVISSGALKNPKMGLIAQTIMLKGFVVNKVDADQEGKFALKALLPKSYKNNAFTVDMGSGNTKINWYEGDKMKTVELVGAKYYQDGKTDSDVYAQVKEAASKIPPANRQYCFVIGGVPYKLAKDVRNGEERFTTLKSPDDYSAGDDVKIKSGLNIYRAIVDGTGTENFIFDWDANFTIGFLMSIN